MARRRTKRRLTQKDWGKVANAALDELMGSRRSIDGDRLSGMAKRRVPQRGGGLTEITESQFNRAVRNRRCFVVGSNEGGATFKCGKASVLSMGHTGSGYKYYKLTGRAAIDTAYAAKWAKRRAR